MVVQRVVKLILAIIGNDGWVASAKQGKLVM